MAEPMALVCPICKSAVQELDLARDATGYHCTRHENFKVAHTVFAEHRDYTSEQWEAALQKAKQRTKPEEWPVIYSYDF